MTEPQYNAIHALPLEALGIYYRSVWTDNDTAVIRDLILNDRFFLLTQMLREDAPKMERERAESKGSRADRRSSARAANAAKWTQGAAIGCEKDPHLAAEIEWQADELSKGKEDGMK